MFIPPKHVINKLNQEKSDRGPIQLINSHLLIDNEIVASHFGECFNVYGVYYPSRRVILIASVDDTLFKDLHKASQYMLKEAKLDSKRSIAIHDILIDNDLDNTDRALSHELNEEMKIITIQI